MEGPYIVIWVELPWGQWTHEWVAAGMRRPCCQLRLSLYGHPISGNKWGNHFTDKCLSVGCTPMSGWDCLFARKKLQFAPSVYLFDFKFVGTAQDLNHGWSFITDTGLALDALTPLCDYLGLRTMPNPRPCYRRTTTP